MKHTSSLIAASLLLALGLPSQAETFTDYARVKQVEPQYERISKPRKECNSEWVNEGRPQRNERSERSNGGAVIGAIAGGLIGNQIGKGHGREAATAFGAVVGALAGDRIDNEERYSGSDDQIREVKRCRTVESYDTRIVGYRVTYEYRGQKYVSFMANEPGRELRLRVSLEPEE